MRDRIIKLSEMNFEKLNVITLTESGGLMGEIVVIKKGHKHKKNKLWQEDVIFATLSLNYQHLQQHKLFCKLIRIQSYVQSPQNGGKANYSPSEYVQTGHRRKLPVPASATGSWHIHPEEPRNDGSVQ